MQQPGYVLPFLNILLSVAAGCNKDVIDEEEDLETADEAADEETQLDDDQQQISSAAAKYFKRRLQQQADHEAAGRTNILQPPATSPQQQQQQQQQNSPLAAAEKLQLPPHQLETLDLTWQRAYSAASLANAAVDAATPLLLQRKLQAAVLAVSVVSAALDALAAATKAIDSEERLFEELVDRGPDAALQPTRPAPAKLLPAVHSVWPMLLACLQDTGSVALLEQGLSLMSKLTRLAGKTRALVRYVHDFSQTTQL
eukprot:gene7800-7997_t